MVRVMILAVAEWLAAIAIILAATRLPGICGAAVVAVVAVLGLASIPWLCELVARYG